MMAAIFILAKHKHSHNIWHINDILDTAERNNFVCTDINCISPELVCVLNTKSKHFRHKSENPNCNATFETALHLAAKEILKNNKFINVPSQGILNYQEAILEKSWEKYRPDVTLKTDNGDFFVEIVVSHPISKEKELQFFIKNKRCIEIDLSNYGREFSQEQLTEDIKDNLTYKRMLYADDINYSKTSDTSDNLLIIGLTVACASIGYLVYRELNKSKFKKSNRWLKG